MATAAAVAAVRVVVHATRRAGHVAVSAVVIVATGGVPIPGCLPDDKTTTTPGGPR